MPRSVSLLYIRWWIFPVFGDGFGYDRSKGFWTEVKEALLAGAKCKASLGEAEVCVCNITVKYIQTNGQYLQIERALENNN